MKNLEFGSANIEEFIFKLNQNLPENFAKFIQARDVEKPIITRRKKLLSILRNETPIEINQLFLIKENESREKNNPYPIFKGIIITFERGKLRLRNEYGRYEEKYERLNIDIRVTLPLKHKIVMPRTKIEFIRDYDEDEGFHNNYPDRRDFEYLRLKPIKINLEKSIPTSWIYPN